MASRLLKQPAIYVPHGGGPWPFVEDPRNLWTNLGTYLRHLPRTLPQIPSAVLIISAHWEAPRFSIASGPNPQLIFDYGGFPAHTYELTYPAPGSPEIAQRVTELAAESNIETRLEPNYGWDHGVFVPLAVSWPNAEVPVVAVSLRAGLDPQEHIEFGTAIEPLRDENVVIIGSGLSTHDLGFRVTQQEGEAFDLWLEETMALPPTDRTERLNRWTNAPGGRASHPREEHLLPLMTIVGAAGSDPATRSLRDSLFGLPIAAYTFA